MDSLQDRNTVLELQKVEKVYPGHPPVRAVNGVSCRLQRGDFASLMGASGSGKTTLLNLSSGLDRVTSGQVSIGGQDLSQLSPHELTVFRRENLGFIFQNYNLFPSLNVQENVEYTRIIRGDDPKLSRQIALQSLEQVGLIDKARRFPSELSGGQQQRVAVARAIASEPKIVFADEPTANLDSRTALQLIELFETLNEKLGLTFLFSTHDQRLVQKTKIKFEMIDGSLDYKINSH